MENNNNKCVDCLKQGIARPNNKKIGDLCGTHHNKNLRDSNKIEKFEDVKISEIQKFNLNNEQNDNLLNIFLNYFNALENKGEDNLLVNRFPELIKEWDFVQNSDNNIDILKMTFSSHTFCYWRCLINTQHLSYKCSLNNKTKLTRKTTGCPECNLVSKRIYDKDKVDSIRENHEPKINTVSIGDEGEKYISDLLKNTGKYKDVEIVGNKGGKGDIKIVNMDDTCNFIQIKTLTKTKNKEDYFYMTNESVYDNNMLMVMLNKERNRFALEFAGKITVKRLTLPFSYEKSKYSNIMFKDENIFLNKLIELIPLSVKINEVNGNVNKEIEMFERLEKFCKLKGITFLRNSTNGNTIDGTINGHTFQAKFRSDSGIQRETISIDSQKSSGRDGNRLIRRNYEMGDFEYMIVEAGGTKDEPDIYKGNFWIANESVLLEQEILKNGDCKGKKCFYICPPDYDKDHWSKKYWNDISSLI
jgi:hypothetical protein